MWITHLLLQILFWVIILLTCIAVGIVALPVWGNFYQTFTQHKYWTNTYIRLWSCISYTRVLSSSLTVGFQDLNIDFKSEYPKTFEQSSRL